MDDQRNMHSTAGSKGTNKTSPNETGSMKKQQSSLKNSGFSDDFPSIEESVISSAEGAEVVNGGTVEVWPSLIALILIALLEGNN